MNYVHANIKKARFPMIPPQFLKVLRLVFGLNGKQVDTQTPIMPEFIMRLV